MAANPYTTNLVLQLDARSITGLSDGDAVGSWLDDSAAGNDASQTTAGYKPLYKTNIVGGNPAVRFQGLDDSLSGSFASWATSAFTVLLGLANNVPDSGRNTAGIISLHAGSGNDFNSTGGFVVRSGVGKDGRNFCSPTCKSGGSYGDVLPPFTNSGRGDQILLPSSASNIVGCGGDGTTVRNYSALGMIGEWSRTLVTGSSVGYVLGNRYLSGDVSTSHGWAGDMWMVLVYAEMLSATNAKSVCQWMATEYGLINASGGGGGLLVGGGMTGGFHRT